MLGMLGKKISADDNLKYLFSYFPHNIGFDISCKLSPKETICMKCQSLFSGKIRKIFICPAELYHGVVKAFLYTSKVLYIGS